MNILLIPPSEYPPSPYIYPIPDSSHRSVTFSAYRHRLNTTSTDIVLEIAATNAHAHTPNQAMGEAKRSYAEAISMDQVSMVFDRKCLTLFYIQTRVHELVVEFVCEG
jgi:hypothetical protein